MASVMLASIFVARVASPTEVGAYFAVAATTAIGGVTAIVGVDKAMTVFLGRSRVSGVLGECQIVRRAYLVGLSGALLVSGGLALGGAGWILPEVVSIGSPQLSLLLALSVGFASVRVLTSESLRGLADIRGATITDTLTPVFVLTGVGVAWLVGLSVGVTDLTLILINASLLAAVFGLSTLVLRLRRSVRPGPAPPIRSYIRIGVPWSLTLVLFFVFTQGSVLLVAMTSTAIDVAIFGIASRVAAVVAVPLAVVLAVLPPYISRLFEQGSIRRLEELSRLAATAASIPAASIALALLLLGPRLIGNVFGEQYAASYLMVIMMSVAFVVAAIAGPCGMVLLLTGHQDRVLLITAITSTATLVAMFLSGLTAGAIGVAASVSLGLVVSNLFLVHSAFRLVGVRTWADPRPSSLATISGALARTVLRHDPRP